MDLKHIIRQPLITEKSLLQAHQGQFSFVVDRRANKLQIKQAIRTLFHVTPVKISTRVIKGKPKRVWGTRHYYRTSDRKIATVWLKHGQSIPLLADWFSLPEVKPSKKKKTQTQNKTTSTSAKKSKNKK